MSLFASKQERRLWLWTLAVVGAIYSTLGPARTVVDALRERNLLQVAFAVLVILVVVVALSQWVKRRPGWSEIAVAVAVALAYGVAFLRIANPAERTHLIEYGVVAALMYQALLERGRHGRLVPMPAAIAVAATALLGLLDEGIQAVLPSRVFDWNDVLFNALAGFMATVASLALAPVERPGWRLWFLWLVAGFVGWGWSMDVSSFGEGPSIALLPSVPAVNIPLYRSVAAGATALGLLQWLMLRRYVTDAALWVGASLAAAALGALVVLGVELWDSNLGLMIAVGMYGVLAGTLQWLVLRRWVARAGWWVPVNTMGWLIAIPVGDITGPPGWSIYSAITATTLVWLLRQGSPDRDP